MSQNRLPNHQWDVSLDPETVPLFLHLQWAQQRSLRGMRPQLVRHGLSAAEFVVLATLRNAPPPHELMPTQIQDRVVITSGGLTKVMLQLEARQLVERRQHSSDLRIKPVRLSPAGCTLIESAMQEMIAGTGDWLRQTLSADEIAQLTQLLARLAGQADD